MVSRLGLETDRYDLSAYSASYKFNKLFNLSKLHFLYQPNKDNYNVLTMIIELDKHYMHKLSCNKCSIFIIFS